MPIHWLTLRDIARNVYGGGFGFGEFVLNLVALYYSLRLFKSKKFIEGGCLNLETLLLKYAHALGNAID